MPDEGHDSNLLPEEWKYLPFLALPDGAHNYQEGTAQTHFVIKSYKSEISVLPHLQSADRLFTNCAFFCWDFKHAFEVWSFAYGPV